MVSVCVHACVCVCAHVHVRACELPLESDITLTRLAENGYKVVGVELSEVAVKRFVTEHQLEYKMVPASNGATVYEVIIIIPYSGKV